MAACSMPDCNMPARARGLCSKHYQRARYQRSRGHVPSLPPLRGHTRSFDHEEAARLYASGVGTFSIGKRFGVGADSVRRALLAQGVVIRPVSARRRFDHDQARKLYDNGMPPARIAALAGVGKNAVRSALLGMGLTLRERSYEPQRVFDHAEVAAVYELDPTVSIPVLAIRYGVHPLSVRKALRRLGVPIRRPARSEDQQLRRDARLLVDTPGIVSGDADVSWAPARWDRGDLWADPTADAVLEPDQEPDHGDNEDERMAVLEWNWAHRGGRIPELGRVSADFVPLPGVDAETVPATTDLANAGPAPEAAKARPPSPPAVQAQAGVEAGGDDQRLPGLAAVTPHCRAGVRHAPDGEGPEDGHGHHDPLRSADPVGQNRREAGEPGDGGGDELVERCSLGGW